MKKCPYCAEEIQDEAIKCRFCGEWLRDVAYPCKNCKAWIRKSDLECSFCGYSYIPKSELSESLTPLEENEKKIIDNALVMNNWNISKAAITLGKDRKTIHNKIKKYDLYSERAIPKQSQIEYK